THRSPPFTASFPAPRREPGAVDSLVEACHSSSPENRALEACRPMFHLLSLIFLRIIPLHKSIDDAPPAAGLRRRRTDFELRARGRAITHVAAGAQSRDQESRRGARRQTVRSNDSPSAPDAGRRGAVAAGAAAARRLGKRARAIAASVHAPAR